jgi:DNA-binding CsgD family transcriptional regulator
MGLSSGEGQALLHDAGVFERAAGAECDTGDGVLCHVAGHARGLRKREVEVLRWLVRGLSNQEIADQLVLSRRTVEAHLRSIFGKLDVTTRSAETRVAIEQGIV